MNTIIDFFLVLLFCVGFYYYRQQVSDNARLRKELDAFVTAYNEDVRASCLYGVDRTCNFVDCAIIPIEQLQADVCKEK